MQIDHIIIYGLKSIVAFEHRLRDDWLDQTPGSLLISGINGSGKSTLLDTIAALWEDLGEWFSDKKHAIGTNAKLFEDCRVAAIRLRDPFPGTNLLWVFYSKANDFAELKNRIDEDPYIGLVDHGRNNWKVESDNPTRTNEYAEFRDQSMAAGRDDIPNVVYITAEDRALLPAMQAQEIAPDAPTNHWFALYGKGQRLTDTLRRFAAQFPERYESLVEDVNRFLRGKSVRTADRGQMFIELFESHGTHDIFGLSTGERQALILIACAHCWLHKGGILLVDEPDLYMHPSWVEQIAGSLRRITKEKRGQFFFTSHSPQLWEDYSREANRIHMSIKTLSDEASTDDGSSVERSEDE